MRADSTKGMYKKAKRKAIVFYKKSKYDNEKLEKFPARNEKEEKNLWERNLKRGLKAAGNYIFCF